MQQARGVRLGEGSEFDVRWYFIDELVDMFTKRIGASTWEPDCFLGLDVHLWDADRIGGLESLQFT
jgi:hypothetical protein